MSFAMQRQLISLETSRRSTVSQCAFFFGRKIAQTLKKNGATKKLTIELGKNHAACVTSPNDQQSG